MIEVLRSDIFRVRKSISYYIIVILSIVMVCLPIYSYIIERDKPQEDNQSFTFDTSKVVDGKITLADGKEIPIENLLGGGDQINELDPETREKIEDLEGLEKIQANYKPDEEAFARAGIDLEEPPYDVKGQLDLAVYNTNGYFLLSVLVVFPIIFGSEHDSYRYGKNIIPVIRKRKYSVISGTITLALYNLLALICVVIGVFIFRRSIDSKMLQDSILVTPGRTLITFINLWFNITVISVILNYLAQVIKRPFLLFVLFSTYTTLNTYFYSIIQALFNLIGIKKINVMDIFPVGMYSSTKYMQSIQTFLFHMGVLTIWLIATMYIHSRYKETENILT